MSHNRWSGLSAARCLLAKSLFTTCLIATCLVASIVMPAEAAHRATCPDYLIVGARGQNQDPRANSGMGPQAEGIALGIAGHLSANGHTVALRRVRYPAANTATLADRARDIATGVRLTRRIVGRRLAVCPHTRFVLVGYSRGAQVMHESLKPLARAPIAAVVLMGDPVRPHKRQTAQTSLGSGRLGGRGNNGQFGFPKRLRLRTLEVCHRLDNVCNVTGAGRTGGISAAHGYAYVDPVAVGRIVKRAIKLIRA